MFAAAGAAVLDDYGVSVDERASRGRAFDAARYVLGDAPLTGQYNRGHNRYYGVSFEAPLLVAEQLLGLTDSRAVHLLRHLGTFRAGGRPRRP